MRSDSDREKINTASYAKAMGVRRDQFGKYRGTSEVLFYRPYDSEEVYVQVGKTRAIVKIADLRRMMEETEQNDQTDQSDQKK